MTTIDYLCPVVTPLKEDATIDEQGCISLWDHLIAHGVSGFLVLGSLGEFHSLSALEKQKLAKLAGEYISDKAELIVGVQSNSQPETVDFANSALKAGADSVMLLPPYYMPYSESELQQYFTDVLPSINGNVFIYNFPDCTGNNLSSTLIRQIFDANSNVVGVKDTVATPATTAQLIQEFRDEDNFRIYSGLDGNFFHNVLSGGAGAIAGMSNVFPELTSLAVDTAGESIGKAKSVQQLLDRASAIYAYSPSLSGAVKTALQARGVQITNRCAGFSTRVSDSDRSEIEAIVRDIEREIAVLKEVH